MANFLFRTLLFLSSYFPLTSIFFVLFIDKNRLAAFFILFVGLIGLIGMCIYFLCTAQRIGPELIRVDSIQRRDGEAMSYIVSYVIPFLAVPFSGWKQGIALAIFFMVLGILYVNSNMIHINPMLNLMGYYLYEVTIENGSVLFIITRSRIGRGDSLSVIDIGENIRLEKGKRP